MNERSSDQSESAVVDHVRTELPRPGMRTFFKQSRRERLVGVLWTLVLKTIFRGSFHSWYGWRVFLLRCFGADVCWSVKIDHKVSIRLPKNLTIGADTMISESVILNCIGKLQIGERVFIDRYCHLCAATHEYQRRDMQLISAGITVCNDVKLDVDVFVGPGVSIGEGTKVGPRSSVVKDLPSNINAKGEPAVEIDQS